MPLVQKRKAFNVLFRKKSSLPHFIPQTASEGAETTETRAPESIVFRAERVENRPKGQEKYASRYLGC